MKIKRMSLIQDMNKVLPGIATGVLSIPDADTVVFNDGHIYSYNSMISVDVVESQETGLKGVAKGVDFYNCLMKLPGDEIEVETSEENWIIHDNTITVKIKLLPEGNLFQRFDSLKPVEENWQQIDGADFHKGLMVCNMPRNTSKYEGLYIKENQFVSTDRYTINTYATKDKYPELWIGNRAVSELLKWENFEAVQFNKMWFQLKTVDGTVFSTRTLDITRYPVKNVLAIVDEFGKLDSEFSSEFTSDFYDAVNRASAFASEDNGFNIVCFNVFSDCSVITSERLSGAYEEKILSITSEKPIKLRFDVQMIKDCATFYNKFKLVTKGEVKKLWFENESGVKLMGTIS